MFQPVIIIGAPRSGTNMLRDMLVEMPGVGTWPCDEINYIWRHGNVRFPSDEFTPDMATPRVQNYIRNEFNKLALANNLDVVVEKTCANSLRVGFVEKVIPNAKYVFIVRDGVDSVGSALLRWKAKFDFLYIIRKARFVPLTDLPYYGVRYLFNHLRRLFSRDKRLAFWGPAVNGIDDLLQKHSLEQVCALQWKSCVDNSERDFTLIPKERVIRIRYEEFVSDPVGEFGKISRFLNKDVPNSVNEYLLKNVRPSSVGKGRNALGQKGISGISPLIEKTLKRYGYE